MKQKPEIGTRVKLASFLGKTHAPAKCDPEENYWKLLGEFGKVIAELPITNQVLVAFECSVALHGLHCHNPEPNTLRIHWSDLEPA